MQTMDAIITIMLFSLPLCFDIVDTTTYLSKEFSRQLQILQDLNTPQQQQDRSLHRTKRHPYSYYHSYRRYRTIKASGCEELYERNYGSGVYYIYPNAAAGVRVKCEMDVDGGGWTVVQQRYDGSVDFGRTWREYKDGFGNLDGEFWLGNEYLHALTSSGKYELRVDMSDWEGNSWYAVYKTFNVGDENSQYRLTVGHYNGSAGDSLAWHNGMSFSTVDRDNDKSPDHCSITLGGNGGWWYFSCDEANLNSLHGRDIGENGIEWEKANSPFNMKTTRMMLKLL